MAENTKIVVDSSAIVNLLLPDEVTADVGRKVDKALKNKSDLFAPDLLIYEVGNVLKTCVLRKRFKENQVFEMFEQFLALGITFIRVDAEKVLTTSLKNGLSYYDAAYFWLAKQQNAKLLTLDKELAHQMKQKFHFSLKK